MTTNERSNTVSKTQQTGSSTDAAGAPDENTVTASHDQLVADGWTPNTKQLVSHPHIGRIVLVRGNDALEHTYSMSRALYGGTAVMWHRVELVPVDVYRVNRILRIEQNRASTPPAEANRATVDYLGRAFTLDVGPGGQVYIRDRHTPVDLSRAFPAYSTDTYDEASAIRLRRCKLARSGSNVYTLNDWNSDANADALLDAIESTAELFHKTHTEQSGK